MNVKDSFAVNILKQDFQQRCNRNPSYSLRAYANFLNLSSGALSSIFNNKRSVPFKAIDHICKKLMLSNKDKDAFIKSIKHEKSIDFKKLASIPVCEKNYGILDESKHYKIISEWEYYALLTLMDTPDFTSNIDWIASRLELTKIRAEEVIDNLIENNLIKVDENKNLTKTYEVTLSTTKNIPSKALREAHQEALTLAKEKLKKIPLNHRFYSMSAVIISPEEMEEVRNLIRDFRRKLTIFLENRNKNRDCKNKEVYHFCTQLYPITKIRDSSTNG